MTRLAVSVEGPTEAEFVKQVLADHLRANGVEPCPIRIGRGGNVTVERLTQEMARLYWTFGCVTSLVDFYGFRDKGDRTVDELEEHLAREIRKKVTHQWERRRVLPYVQRHEFEGLLFSDVDAFSRQLNAPDESVRKLHTVRSQFPNPEDINDNKDTAPSKRITSAIPGYRKLRDGPLVARETGLDAIRNACPRFNEWLKKLESLD